MVPADPTADTTHQQHFCGMPLLTPLQSYPSDASEIQSLGYILTLAAKETQKVTSDFEEVEFRRPGILQSQKYVQKVLNSQSMKQMSTSLSKQFFFFLQLLENIDLLELGGARPCPCLTAGRPLSSWLFLL